MENKKVKIFWDIMIRGRKKKKKTGGGPPDSSGAGSREMGVLA